ncbi:MAG: type II toxin-antitoxin system HicB family antitoxin [Peptococcaceae bacterium]
MKYAVIIKKTKDNYSAYLPDVPGCVAAGDTPEETLKLLTEALEMHLQGLKEDGLPVPEPITRADYVEVAG